MPPYTCVTELLPSERVYQVIPCRLTDEPWLVVVRPYGLECYSSSTLKKRWISKTRPVAAVAFTPRRNVRTGQDPPYEKILLLTVDGSYIVLWYENGRILSCKSASVVDAPYPPPEKGEHRLFKMYYEPIQGVIVVGFHDRIRLFFLSSSCRRMTKFFPGTDPAARHLAGTYFFLLEQPIQYHNLTFFQKNKEELVISAPAASHMGKYQWFGVKLQAAHRVVKPLITPFGSHKPLYYMIPLEVGTCRGFIGFNTDSLVYAEDISPGMTGKATFPTQKTVAYCQLDAYHYLLADDTTGNLHVLKVIVNEAGRVIDVDMRDLRLQHRKIFANGMVKLHEDSTIIIVNNDNGVYAIELDESFRELKRIYDYFILDRTSGNNFSFINEKHNRVLITSKSIVKCLTPGLEPANRMSIPIPDISNVFVWTELGDANSSGGHSLLIYAEAGLSRDGAIYRLSTSEIKLEQVQSLDGFLLDGEHIVCIGRIDDATYQVTSSKVLVNCDMIWEPPSGDIVQAIALCAPVDAFTDEPVFICATSHHVYRVARDGSSELIHESSTEICALAAVVGRLAVSTWDGCITVVDFYAKSVVYTGVWEGAVVRSILLTGNLGGRLWLGSVDGQVRRIDLYDSPVIVMTVTIGKSPVSMVSYSPCGNQLMFLSDSLVGYDEQYLQFKPIETAERPQMIRFLGPGMVFCGFKKSAEIIQLDSNVRLGSRVEGPDNINFKMSSLYRSPQIDLHDQIEICSVAWTGHEDLAVLLYKRSSPLEKVLGLFDVRKMQLVDTMIVPPWVNPETLSVQSVGCVTLFGTIESCLKLWMADLYIRDDEASFKSLPTRDLYENIESAQINRMPHTRYYKESPVLLAAEPCGNSKDRFPYHIIHFARVAAGISVHADYPINFDWWLDRETFLKMGGENWAVTSETSRTLNLYCPDKFPYGEVKYANVFPRLDSVASLVRTDGAKIWCPIAAANSIIESVCVYLKQDGGLCVVATMRQDDRAKFDCALAALEVAKLTTTDPDTGFTRTLRPERLVDGFVSTKNKAEAIRRGVPSAIIYTRL